MNTRNVATYLFAIALLVCCFIESDARTQGVVVQGTVTNRSNQSVPGVTVTLFHPQMGRSNSSVTDAWGRYSIYRVPTHPKPYYIEVYWGRNLIYRAPVQVVRSVVMNIRIR